MLQNIIVLVLVALAVAYLVRRCMRKGGSSCGCAEGGSCRGPSNASGTVSSGCCGGQAGLEPMSECGCGRKD